MAYVLEVETSFPVAAAVGSENLSKIGNLTVPSLFSLGQKLWEKEMSDGCIAPSWLFTFPVCPFTDNH